MSTRTDARTADEAATSGPNRVRRSVLVSVVLVTVLATGAIAAIGTVDRSSTPHRTPPASNTSVSGTGASTTPGSTTSTTACTSADLEARGDVPMPTPEVVTHHIAFRAGALPVVDPPSSTQPSITAAEAWQTAKQFGFTASRRGTYEMLLGNLSSLTVSNRLVWLIVGHHVPNGFVSGPRGVTRPLCYVADLLQPIDATTGQSLFIETGDFEAP